MLALGCRDPDPNTSPRARDAAARDAGARDAAPVGPVELTRCSPAQATELEDAALALAYGPLLGGVSDRSIRIWVGGDRPGRFVVRLWAEDAPDRMRCTTPIVVDQSGDFTGVALIDQLEPSTRYAYRIEAESAADSSRWVPVTEPGEFRTLPREGEPARIRFAVAADVTGDDVPGFSDIAAVSPDFVLMIGDNVYADGGGSKFEGYQARYQTVWGGSQFRALFAETPVFMIWDDHEIMENYWFGKNDKRYQIGRQLYDIYQGSHNPDPVERGELYYAFHAADIGFFVLDTRTHRSANTDDDDEHKSMLGSAQRQAFEKWLATDDSRVHVIVSSVLFSDFTTTGKDSWRSFSTERDALYAVIAENATANTFIVSGDQHWSAVLRFTPDDRDPYTLYEFQSTPLGSGERAAPQETDRTVLGLDNQHNVFGVFDVDTRVDPPTLDFTMCAVDEDCNPHDERAPVTTENSHTTLPYTLRFRGGPTGFELLGP